MKGESSAGIEDALEGVDDVPRRQLVPVMKGDAVAQVGDVGQRVGVVEALRQCRPDSKVVAMLEQRAVDEL